MPRSLPVITGLPLRAGSLDCSQAAKKASPSIWRMALSNELMESGWSFMSRLLKRWFSGVSDIS
jgi:hypothetical protein